MRAGVLAAAAFLAAVWPHAAGADEAGCQLPPALGQQYSWSPGGQVTVYIDPNFSAGAISEVEAGIGAWENAGGSGVHFEFSVEYGRAHVPPSGTMGVVPDATSSGSAGENRLTSGGNRLDHAQIVIDTSQVYTADVFRRVAIHETAAATDRK